MTLLSTVEHIRRYSQFLVVSHVNPDGDAVGSLLAVGWILRGLGKQATLALQDAVPDELRVLPGVDAIVSVDGVSGDHECVICVDASSPDRMGAVYRPQLTALPLLVIDHHITNTRFGTVNWVAADCASTCQMLVDLADALHAPLGGPLGQCLLTGIVTDTLGFRTNNTTPAVLASAMRLMQAGASLVDITESVLDRRSFGVVKLWGAVLSHARLEDGVLWVTVSQEAMDVSGAAGDDGSLSSMLIRTTDAEISASFVEKIGENGQPAVECSFRARRGFDVSRVALGLGGGGHRAAAGCTVVGPLDDVAVHVVGLLQAARRQQLAESGHAQA